ncbi:MAG: family 16 glycosylhydrolase [Candidatus Marinimicrobia bacterium]|jgi:hypothetical protein|nr:family 16 glycosylhydrolase [Candidatus Neomarinimicrobiota bacterium]MBT3630802.1 family 16 glycosylhydrolase [Candidatus Neomarinimicrobiota bacterium]MBT3825604.1 family 16 glycosylhydrolase [Candidatus Neomarinimicrobiota bacterium]MBT4131176.1 family 16 glycosylhydrolase [Candidatus Neomarinimicrobiota bacterium]MBT4296364.1 family 16 glycosylhydrolase [Candidatus Neomarinimicrobiota bacterium]
MKNLYGNIFSSLLILIFASSIWAKDYRGAELRTLESLTYGRFEVRMRSAEGSGMLSSFFTYNDGGSGWNEIDVEILGAAFNEVQFNTITPGQVNHVYDAQTWFNPHYGYHVYAFEWTPEYVAWFIDGIEIHRQTGLHIEQLVHSQKIMMNIWQPIYVNWVGPFDPNILPVFAHYDWVKYYDYNPDEGDYGSENKFLHAWTDDFSHWDQNRWAKATHTFNGNNVDFIHNNISFYNGNMILSLTQPWDQGFDPTVPPIDQDLHEYNSFEGGDVFDWYLWDGSSSNAPAIVDNPDPGGINSSTYVGEWAATGPDDYLFLTLPEKLDLIENHTFSLLVYTESPITQVTFKLQNHELADPTTTQIISRQTIDQTNLWTTLYFEFSYAVNRQDLDQIVIQFMVGGMVSNCYYDNIYGPPIFGTGIDNMPERSALIEINNYPNPFNSETTFAFTLQESAFVSIDILDLRGQLVTELVSDFHSQGEHRLVWSANNLNSGIYLARFQFNGHIIQKKILLIK